MLQSGLSDHTTRLLVQGRIGAANAAEFFGVLREMQAGVDVLRLGTARPGAETLALLPRSHGDELFTVRALIAVEGLRCELALRQPNLRSVAGDNRIGAVPGHRLELPEDLLAVRGWDWVRPERRREPVALPPGASTG